MAGPNRSWSRTSGTSTTSGDRGPGGARATPSPPRTRWSRSSPTRRRWRSRRRSPARSRRSRWRSATRSREGSPILLLEVDGGNGAAPDARGAPSRTRPPRRPGRRGRDRRRSRPRPRPRRPRRAAPASPQAGSGEAPAYATPGVRRLARELGVDLARGPRDRPQGPDHQGGRAEAAAAPRPPAPRPAARPRSPAWTSPRGRRSTSSATARSSASRSRASRRSAARTWPATG